MALCATPLENSSFFACQSEKKSLKRFSNFTSKKVFGHFLSSGKDKSRKSEVAQQQSVEKKTTTTTSHLHCRSDSFSSADKRRPLVQNKENNFVNVFGEKIVISKKSLDGNVSKRSLPSPDHYHHLQKEYDVNHHHHQQQQQQQHMCFNNMRKCYSNEISELLNKSQLNKERNDVRRSMESPPRLLPFSGRLSCEKFKDVVKPIACKPCSSYARKTASQDCILTQVNNDEGYNSRNMSNSSAVTSSSSSSSSSNFFVENSSQEAESAAGSRHVARQLSRPRPKSSMLTSTNNKKVMNEESSRLVNCRRLSVYHINNNNNNNNDPLNVSTCNNDDDILNSSGLDVFQRRLVDKLEKKEKELRDLRARMEANEKAMTGVFESKQEEWKVEVNELDGKWQEKMRWHQQKAFRSEQSLLIQIMELRKENNFLKEKFSQTEKEVEDARRERDEAQKSVDQLRTHLEEAHWQTSQKLDEIVSLRSQLNDNDNINNNRQRSQQQQHVYETILSDDGSSHTHSCLDKHDDFLNHRSKCSSFTHPKSGDCLESILWSSGNNTSSNNSNINNNNVETSFSQQNSCSDDAFFRLGEVISQVEDLRKQSELQNHAWLFEKSKVIDYQKKLQTSYLEVCQKNQLLQDEVVRLRRKMEMSALDSIETESFC